MARCLITELWLLVASYCETDGWCSAYKLTRERFLPTDVVATPSGHLIVIDNREKLAVVHPPHDPLTYAERSRFDAPPPSFCPEPPPFPLERRARTEFRPLSFNARMELLVPAATFVATRTSNGSRLTGLVLSRELQSVLFCETATPHEPVSGQQHTRRTIRRARLPAHYFVDPIRSPPAERDRARAEELESMRDWRDSTNTPTRTAPRSDRCRVAVIWLFLAVAAALIWRYFDREDWVETAEELLAEMVFDTS